VPTGSCHPKGGVDTGEKNSELCTTRVNNCQNRKNEQPGSDVAKTSGSTSLIKKECRRVRGGGDGLSTPRVKDTGKKARDRGGTEH